QFIPARQFIRQCKVAGSRIKVADSAGTELSGTKLLTAALLFRKLVTSKVGADEKMIGLLLPPSAGGAIANAAVTLLGRVAVNLNYTLSQDVVDFCIDECGIKHVLTSRRFQEKKPFAIKANYIYLEDLTEEAPTVSKALCAASARFEPISILERRLGLTNISPDELITVIFTSGSTGQPKGVMLSHNNVLSNLTAVDQLFNLTEKDALIGVLPFFHSFGFTITMWLPFCVEPSGIYHFNPLDGRTVGKLAEKYDGTILAATPTFLRTYTKRCTPEQFAKMSLVISGAEKLPAELANAFKDKFGVEVTEGYGTTELSPAAAFNVPASRLGPNAESATKAGTVGRVMPGATAKIVDADTGEDLGINDEGLLRIKGPNVMTGYLNLPEKTNEVIIDGWYDTGDMAMIDADGFISITGRMSRFSKIGGEMVPHIRIEEELARIVDEPDDEEPNILIAVTAVPDPKKGEKLIVLHKPLKKPIDEALQELGECGLPNIWLPSADGFLEVEEIPLLGTGKLDLKGVKEKAMEHFGPR
ncbi:MAG: AMP-binding protein, partial [Planctomycetaceae bacterium]